MQKFNKTETYLSKKLIKKIFSFSCFQHLKHDKNFLCEKFTFIIFIYTIGFSWPGDPIFLKKCICMNKLPYALGTCSILWKDCANWSHVRFTAICHTRSRIRHILEIFEMDHPSTQEFKKKRLTKVEITLSSNVQLFVCQCTVWKFHRIRLCRW